MNLLRKFIGSLIVGALLVGTAYSVQVTGQIVDSSGKGIKGSYVGIDVPECEDCVGGHASLAIATFGDATFGEGYFSFDASRQFIGKTPDELLLSFVLPLKKRDFWFPAEENEYVIKDLKYLRGIRLSTKGEKKEINLGKVGPYPNFVEYCVDLSEFELGETLGHRGGKLDISANVFLNDKLVARSVEVPKRSIRDGQVFLDLPYGKWKIELIYQGRVLRKEFLNELPKEYLDSKHLIRPF